MAGEMDRTAYAEQEANLEPSLKGEGNPSVDLIAVYQVLRAGRKEIGIITGAAVAIAVLIAFLLPAQYTATASFIPPSLGGSSSMASAILGQIPALAGGSDLMSGLKNPGDVYAGILDSRSVLDSLVKQFDLLHVYKVKKQSDADKILASSTKVTVDPKSSIVSLEVTARSPQLAHDLANAYLEELRRTNGRLALSQASQRRLFFQEQLNEEKNNLADAEVALKQTQERSGLIAPAGQTATQIRIIAETQAQIAGRQVQLAALKQYATDENPEVISLRSEISNLQDQLAQLQKGDGTGSATTIPTSKVPGLELDYIRKERDLKYHETLFEMLARQYESARLDEAREAPIVQVLDPASYPDTKSRPRRKLIALLGVFLGLLLGSVWVIGRARIRLAGTSLFSSRG
jgi:tyrosine-protein kinase Etk/Wzc